MQTSVFNVAFKVCHRLGEKKGWKLALNYWQMQNYLFGCKHRQHTTYKPINHIIHNAYNTSMPLMVPLNTGGLKFEKILMISYIHTYVDLQNGGIQKNII